jgi:hypothetical protein
MSVTEKNRIRIAIKDGTKIKSLCWCDDELVDFAAGGVRYRLDGTITRPNIFFAYRFDRAVVSRDGKYAIIYETFGTKGLVLHDGRLLREINRSYYHANVYEYPIDIIDLPDGRTAIAHCPEAYNKIEFEEIKTGQRLTTREGKAADFFHSRLQATPDGEHLLSAGWVWHPLDDVRLFPIREVLQRPSAFDKNARLDLPDELFEVHAAVFQGNEAVIMVGDSGGEPGEEGPFLVRYDLKESRVNLKTRLEETAGTIMAAGSEFIVGFCRHPKLIEISSGKVIQRWLELDSGEQNSSIVFEGKLPLLALDSNRMRFALADSDGITVIQLG